MKFSGMSNIALTLLSLCLPFTVLANNGNTHDLEAMLSKAETQAKHDAQLLTKFSKAHTLLQASRDSEARKIFRDLADEGFAPSMHVLGMILMRDGDPSGFKWIQKASELNYPPAQCYEATEYISKLKLTEKQSDRVELSKRIQLLVKKSSDGRYARCQLLQSMSPSLNKIESANLLMASARQRDGDAQALIAEMYENGTKPYSRNLVESYAWYSNALINGSSFSNLSAKFETLKKVMPQDSIDKARKLSREYYATLKENDHVLMWINPPLF
ncbi:MAG: hypothetical protein ACRC8G_14920 [Plesiomonas shigelloides]